MPTGLSRLAMTCGVGLTEGESIGRCSSRTPPTGAIKKPDFARAVCKKRRTACAETPFSLRSCPYRGTLASVAGAYQGRNPSTDRNLKRQPERQNRAMNDINKGGGRLTEQQRWFIAECAKDFNATQAAISQTASKATVRLCYWEKCHVEDKMSI